MRHIKEEILKRIDALLAEPNYQHEGEDWRAGLEMAREIVEDAFLVKDDDTINITENEFRKYSRAMLAILMIRDTLKDLD